MKIADIEQKFKGCDDFVSRKISVGGDTWQLFYIDNLSDRLFISSSILRPLAEHGLQNSPRPLEDMITNGRLEPAEDFAQAVNMLLSGAALLIDGSGQCTAVFVRNEASRGISEPETETVIRGPREGFVESAAFNASLIRRRIKSADLKYESVTAGKLSGTNIIIMYISGLADMDTVEQVRRRISEIDIDGVTESGVVEMYIQQGRVPLYPTVGNSERPDKVAAKLLEGRVAVLCDGSPVVLTVPYLFVEGLQSSEDYSKSPYYATFIRLLRFFAMCMAVYLPAVFIAIMYFHQTVIPYQLLMKIDEARADIPFSVFIETVIILLLFEIIREVGVRMPRSVGNAVGIVGAIILGDSAVSAGIASTPVIIIVAVTAICNFIVPPYMNLQIILRLAVLICARLLGLFGIGLFTLVLVLRLCSVNSFGTPYMAPFAPASGTGLLDSLIMVPVWRMHKVPPQISGKNITRARSKGVNR